MERSDYTGKTFGYLRVIAFERMGSHGSRYYRCVCVCGKEHVAQRSNLRSGRVSSCGCKKRELMSKRLRRHGWSRATLPGYGTWVGMRQRCFNKSSKQYPQYGGRGITVCDRWKDSVENFIADMGPRPKGMSLDRIDNNGNYEPANCRWATPRQQQNNCRNTRVLTANGASLPIQEWGRRIGIPANVIKWRLSRGWTPERTVSEPKHGTGPKHRRAV